MRQIVASALVALCLVSVPAPARAAKCGQPLSNGAQPTATDALYILRSSVGTVLCTLSACDTSSDCVVTASDALRSLQAAVGRTVKLGCQASCPAQAPCIDTSAAVCNGICAPGFACTADNADLTVPDQRVTVCHFDGSVSQTRTVDPARLLEHLNHGDTLGSCPQSGAAVAAKRLAAPQLISVSVLTEAGTPSVVVTQPGSPQRISVSVLTAPAPSEPELGVGACSCQPLTVTQPTTTLVADGSTTTTSTTTSTTNTLPPPPPGDPDNDGLVDADDPCPLDVRNRCFGPLAIDSVSNVPIRINADSSGLHECAGLRTDCAGDTWYRDFGYNSPFTGHACDVDTQHCTIQNLELLFGCRDAATEDILQCEHFDRVSLPELAYHFNVPNGTYVVNLFFANTYKTTRAPGKRIFDIAIEGQVVYPDFDQVAVAGGSRVALVRSAVVTVADGNGLQIDFGHIVENPTIKAIEVFAGP
jgi:hypothetical protein